MELKASLATLLFAFALCGCSTNDSAPLVFGQGTTVGISAGPSPTNQASPELIVGVKHANIALVPTVIPGDIAANASSRKIVAHGRDQAGKGEQDALSTFGSFSNTTQSNKVDLGIFFATGVAAQNISNGFKCGVLADSAQTECAKKTSNPG